MSEQANSKRALRNQYKETKVPMGVFIIRNLVDNRVYIGATTNLEGAINRNRFELTMKTHRNKRLLRDWLAHGAQAFLFEVLDTLEHRIEPNVDYEAELAALRDMWREEHDAYGERGYHTRPTHPGQTTNLESESA